MNRFRFLRRLSLSLGRIMDEELAFVLEGALKTMSHLNSLTIHKAEDLLLSRKRLRLVISRIPTLRHLELYNAQKLTCRLVKDLHVGLKSLRLGYGQLARPSGGVSPFLETVDEQQVQQYHPVSLCKQVAPTLEELFIARGMGGYPLPDDSVTYPHMRKLMLEDDLPNASAYIRKFPNLTYLSVTSNYGVNGSFADYSEEYLLCRQNNITEHLRGITWKHLRTYQGQLLGLYLIAPLCPIERLIFKQTVDRSSLSLLRPVLDTAKPTHLDITFLGNPLGPSPLEIPAVLREPVCASLESLKISITLDRADRDSDIGVCTESLLSSLASLPLSSLHLTIVTGGLVDPTRPTIESDPKDPEGVIVTYVPYPLVPVERSLDVFESLTYAQKVADAVSTIQDVTIRVCGPREKHARGTRLRRGRDGAMETARL
ncbi:hypothetical protein L226DRAFT_555904 [Lentinus tigrinus ALCF2SS1-7]|uniref:uncharacterized protein n=1 Tax=Lentinus tigrinus ALCF2SS1-7 TaxID=1328758 RepID=UPI001165EC06|nr:hypothetical protein L226DRAFT_555904 [Lentinus tigrinus ALCF2SS1-7]